MAPSPGVLAFWLRAPCLWPAVCTARSKTWAMVNVSCPLRRDVRGHPMRESAHYVRAFVCVQDLWEIERGPPFQASAQSTSTRKKNEGGPTPKGLSARSSSSRTRGWGPSFPKSARIRRILHLSATCRWGQTLWRSSSLPTGSGR